MSIIDRESTGEKLRKARMTWNLRESMTVSTSL
jgi:hypothetical protein